MAARNSSSGSEMEPLPWHQDAAVLNWMSLAGMVVLAVPALSLDRRKRDLARVEALSAAADAATRADLLRQLGASLTRRRTRAVAAWRRADRACLWLGYGLVLLAAFLRALAS